jgi:hypothetical protein
MLDQGITVQCTIIHYYVICTIIYVQLVHTLLYNVQHTFLMDWDIFLQSSC